MARSATWSTISAGPGASLTSEPFGRLARDGDILVELDGESLRERRKLLWSGAATATLVIDQEAQARAEPVVSLRGIEDPDGRLGSAIVSGLKEMLADLDSDEREDDERIREAARQAVRRVVRVHLGKKPLTDVHIVRI
jgi:ribonuclease J